MVAVVAVVGGLGGGSGGRAASRLDDLAVVAVAVDLGLAVGITGLAAAPAALVALADHVLLALVGVALLDDALAVVADDLLVALVALALGELAVVALADDELVPVVGAAVLGVALVAFADDALVLAALAVAGVLGGAVVAAADNLLLVPLGGRADGDRLDDDAVRLGADGAVGDGGGAGGDGADVGAGDGRGAGGGVALVGGHCRAGGDVVGAAHLGGLAAAVLGGHAGAGQVALALVILLGGRAVNGVGAEAVAGCMCQWLCVLVAVLLHGHSPSNNTHELGRAAGGAQVEGHLLIRGDLGETGKGSGQAAEELEVADGAGEGLVVGRARGHGHRRVGEGLGEGASGTQKDGDGRTHPGGV